MGQKSLKNWKAALLIQCQILDKMGFFLDFWTCVGLLAQPRICSTNLLRYTPVKNILVWKVLCLFCFEICTPEGRGGEEGGIANFKSKHTEPFIFLPVYKSRYLSRNFNLLTIKIPSVKIISYQQICFCPAFLSSPHQWKEETHRPQELCIFPVMGPEQQHGSDRSKRPKPKGTSIYDVCTKGLLLISNIAIMQFVRICSINMTHIDTIQNYCFQKRVYNMNWLVFLDGFLGFAVLADVIYVSLLTVRFPSKWLGAVGS